MVKAERWYREKDWDVVNDVKLRGIVRDQSSFEKRLFLRTKHTGYWLSVLGNTVTSKVLDTTCFSNIYMLVIILTPLAFKINLKVASRPYMCVTFSSEATEVSSSHVTM